MNVSFLFSLFQTIVLLRRASSQTNDFKRYDQLPANSSSLRISKRDTKGAIALGRVMVFPRANRIQFHFLQYIWRELSTSFLPIHLTPVSPGADKREGNSRVKKKARKAESESDLKGSRRSTAANNPKLTPKHTSSNRFLTVRRFLSAVGRRCSLGAQDTAFIENQFHLKLHSSHRFGEVLFVARGQCERCPHLAPPRTDQTSPSRESTIEEPAFFTGHTHALTANRCLCVCVKVVCVCVCFTGTHWWMM